MAKGISVHIGLNYVDPNHYNGWDGQLNACENDASDMERIAKSRGFETRAFLRDDATRNQVKDSINHAAKNLEEGDIFYLSYSGHGGQVPDKNSDEPDMQDETWCLYDGQLIDDELHELWYNFKKGVRIFITSDSCHSGTVIKEAGNSNMYYGEFPARNMSSQHALATYASNQRFYDDILSTVKKIKPSDVQASVLLISGCQDNQYSYDGTFNGAFTGALKRVWNGGKFKGDYPRFHKQIQNLLPAYQSPNYMFTGTANPGFESQRPFAIE